MTNDVLVGALVKLRHRIAGEAICLSQSEAQALYMAVLPPDTERADVGAASVGCDPRGVAERQRLGWTA